MNKRLIKRTDQDLDYSIATTDVRREVSLMAKKKIK